MSSNKEIIVIDFDETLYKKDSLIELCKFIYQKKPFQGWALLVQIFASVLHFLRIINSTRFKELFLYFLYNIPEEKVEKLVKEFWENKGMENFHANITDLFKRKEYRIICVSASPELFIKPIADVYQIELIGTLIYYHQHKYFIKGENCKGEEKVLRLKKYLNQDKLSIAESYSDSWTDKPLFDISKKAYMVKEDGSLKLITSLHK
jgi:HAD superfamily hydrolase (TIGR01490 family)